MAARQRRLIIYLPHHQPIWRLPEGYLETIRRRALKSFEIDIPMNEEAFVAVLPRAEVLFAWKPPLLEVRGKVLGILGLGDIGRELAARARALGMVVWGLARTPRPKPDDVDRLLPAGKEDALIRESDVLVLAVPLTRLTQGMIGERQLKSMKHTAYLVNIGRGEVVQESALVRALREGWIAGAGLDVYATEPLPPGSPLWRLPQVVMTPHIAGTHPQYMERAADLFIANLKRYLAGGPLINEVDKQAGC